MISSGEVISSTSEFNAHLKKRQANRVNKQTWQMDVYQNQWWHKIMATSGSKKDPLPDYGDMVCIPDEVQSQN